MERAPTEKFFGEIGEFTWSTSIDFKGEFIAFDSQSCVRLKIMDTATMGSLYFCHNKSTIARTSNTLRNLKAHYLERGNQRRVSKEDLEIDMIVVAQVTVKRFVRAKIMKVNETDPEEDEIYSVKIFDCDEGFVVDVPGTRIFWILPEFLETAFQVRKCRLAGYGLKMTVGSKLLYNLMKDRSKELLHTDVILTGLDLTDLSLPGVVVYLKTTRAHSFNEIVWKQVEKYKPKLSSPEAAMISHAESDGTIWIQKDTELLRILVNCVKGGTEVASSSGQSKKENPEDLDKAAEKLKSQLWSNRVLFGRYTDGNFYRICILDHDEFQRTDRLNAEYMEFGNRQLLQYKDVMLSHEFREDMCYLEKIPKQCIAVKLANIGHLDIGKFWNYIDVDTTIITVEVIEDKWGVHNRDLIPLVEVFMWPEGMKGRKVSLNEVLLREKVAQPENLSMA